MYMQHDLNYFNAQWSARELCKKRWQKEEAAFERVYRDKY